MKMKPAEIRFAIGVDIGGTSTKLALVDSQGRLHFHTSLPTPVEGDPDTFSAQLVDAAQPILHEVIAKSRVIQGVGIAVAGFVDEAHARMIYNPNLPALEGFPLAKRIQEVFDLPVFLDSDSNSATLGEDRFGAGQDSRRFLCIAIGTGVGVGMTIDGELLRFAYECMGDPGHVIVQPGGLQCNCGCFGCAEAIISAPGIVRRAMDALPEHTDSVLALETSENQGLDFSRVLAASQSGDRFACELIAETGHYLGVALASLSPIFLPDCIAIAGGVSEAGSALLDPALATLRQTSGSFYTEKLRLVKANLGSQATVLGAACPFL